MSGDLFNDRSQAITQGGGLGYCVQTCAVYGCLRRFYGGTQQSACRARAQVLLK